MIPAHLKGRDFLRVNDWEPDELLLVLDHAERLKARQRERVPHRLLEGRSVGMIFQKPSTRTRVSFEVGIAQLGGTGLYLAAGDLQLGRGETIKDTAVVLSRYLDGIMIRTFEQADVDELAEHADIPVINGLTDEFHPCQALADVLTIRERLGGFEGVRVAYLGDGNNVCHSLMVACAKLGTDFVAATPPGYEPAEEVVGWARAAAEAGGTAVELTNDPRAAATGADVLYTDVWTSMGQDEEREQRLADLGRLRDRRRPGRPRQRAGDRPPLPAGALRRGDRRGRALRRALRRLGPGREPAARPEGADGARHQVVQFEQHVRAALDSLPPKLRDAMSNVEIVVEDENDEDPDLFGLYLGIPLTERGVESYAGVLPDKIAIYRIPLEEEFGHDPELLEEEIQHHGRPRDRAPLRDRRGPHRGARLGLAQHGEE